jgi:uncharacterized protein (DUF302 family)
MSDTTEDDNGIINVRSSHSFDETFGRLESAARSKGLTIFATIDFDGDAERAGLKMRRTKMLIFGSPKSGTPLMLAAPSLAIDLPLKILVSEDAEGKTVLSYNSPAYLKERHKIPKELLKNIAGVESIAASVAA